MSPWLFNPWTVLSGERGKSIRPKVRLRLDCPKAARGRGTEGTNPVACPSLLRPNLESRFAGPCAWLGRQNIPSTTSSESELRENLQLAFIILISENVGGYGLLLADDWAPTFRACDC